MRVRGARTTAARVEPFVVSTPLSNAKQRFQGMADFAPRAIRIALLTPERGVHARQHAATERWTNRDYSITSSAIDRRLSEIFTPSALAVLRLITSSNLLDCTTGRSAGFSPLRIRAVRLPATR
jgi:hypothetical protein